MALALENGAVRKYDESEPRDERGRWTAAEPTTEPADFGISGSWDTLEPRQWSTEEVEAARAKGWLTDGERRAIADRLNGKIDAFRAAGGYVRQVEAPNRIGGADATWKARQNLNEQWGNGNSGSGTFGTSYALHALSAPYVNIAYDMYGEVAGAHGFEIGVPEFGNEAPVAGHGIIGTTGIVEGAGSALVGEYIKLAAAAKVDVEIDPIPAAESFWESCGFKIGGLQNPPGTWNGWGMSVADSTALASLLH